MQVLFVFSLILPTYGPTDRDCSRGPSGPKKDEDLVDEGNLYHSVEYAQYDSMQNQRNC